MQAAASLGPAAAHLSNKNDCARIDLVKIGNTAVMMKPKNTIDDVKRMINDYLSSRISVKVNLGRNKHVEYCGVLSSAYPALFAVTPDEEGFLGKTVYSYSDVLCGTVKLKKIS